MSAPVPSRLPLSERLRSLVCRQASEATLTCVFVPGGQLHGVGIPSTLYCVTCGQSRTWHDVAESIPDVLAAEEIMRRARAQEEASHGAYRC